MGNQYIYSKCDNNMKEKDSDAYTTPPWLYSYIKENHDINIDLASSDENKKEKVNFTIENSALDKNWSDFGSIGFCNPPFSRGMKEVFLSKAYAEMVNNSFSSVFVIPADITNKAWADLIIGKATRITVVSGRVKFYDPITKKESKAGLGVAIVEFLAGNQVDDKIHFIDRDEIKSVYE